MIDLRRRMIALELARGEQPACGVAVLKRSLQALNAILWERLPDTLSTALGAA